MQFHSTIPANFFELVEIHPLSHRANKYNIETQALQIISHQFEYRGSKVQFETKQPPFWLTHEETFVGACEIFESLFNHKPDLFAWFHDDLKKWNAFLVTSRDFHPFEDDHVPDLAPDLAYASEHDIYRRYFRHFPVIGSYNSYEADSNPSFYYLIATPFGVGKGSFLTLSNFRFQRYEEKARFVIGNPYYTPNALNYIVKLITDQFAKDERRFNDLLNKMAGGEVETRLFGPVVLDLYDINRNEESVVNDNQLQQRIRRLIQSAIDFSHSSPARGSIPWTEFIQFIIRNNEFDISGGLRKDEVEELFARKRAYTKFERVFTKFLDNYPRYQRYVQDQLVDWQSIQKYL